jgi:hypothetical protein
VGAEISDASISWSNMIAWFVSEAISGKSEKGRNLGRKFSGRSYEFVLAG